MKILHVAPSFYPAHLYGGPVVSLYRLALSQRAAGHEVRVLTSDANGRGARLPGVGGRWVEEHGVPTWYARALLRQDYSAEIGWRLPPLLRWADVTHVTAVFSPTSMLALSLGAALRRPVVLSPRGSLMPFALSKTKRAVLRALGPALRRVAAWHVTSKDEAAGLAALGLVGPGAAVLLVENGVDLAEFPAPPELADDAEAAAPSTERRGPVLTMLGRLDPIKGLDLGLEALALLLRRHPGAELVLAGPDRDGHGRAIAAEAQRRGLPVRLPGLVTGAEKAALLGRTDALWLLSRMESFGNVVLEALGAGAPVVAVDTTPWRWLEEAAVGRHVPRSAAAVADATCALLAEAAAPAARRALRRRCRAAVAERFSWPAIARRMDDLYLHATAASHRAPISTHDSK